MSTRIPSAVFCGPQSIPATWDTYNWVRLCLQKDPELRDLAQEIRELPALWSKLMETHALCDSSIGDPLKTLRDWLGSGSQQPLTVPESLPNVLIAPLNVIAQLAQYYQYLRDKHHAGTSHADILESVSSSKAGIQGLCTGFLTATALACSQDLAELNKNGIVAVRLAMCIGAAVDADERERTRQREGSRSLVAFGSPDLDHRKLIAALKEYSRAYISVKLDAHRVTITAAEKDVPRLTEDLIRHGIKVRNLQLNGRYHNSVHREIMKALKAICDDEHCLRFPAKSKPFVPLRCNTTGELVQDDVVLHEVCLRSILMEPADWHSIVSSTVKEITQAPSHSRAVLELGFTSCLPGSLAIRSGLEVVAVLPEMCEGDPAFSYPAHSIAIIGAAGRFSGAENLDQLWHLLRTGVSTISIAEQDASNSVRGDDCQTATASYLSDVDGFDRGLFGYSPSEAEFMDPQHRAALQVAYETVEGAGYLSPDSSSQRDVGCYVGIATSDYEANVACHCASAFSFTGTARSFISGRISHHFGWTGPSIALDTACSSSAVAIHLACKDLIANECKMALAGGVSIIANDRTSKNLAAAHFLSVSSGPCRAFDAAADGFSRGEGCGFILLKRLEDAQLENDQILGVITGTATNQNINCGSITVPVHESQVDVYRRSLAASGIEPSRVSYIEAHGTGTSKGDPIEYHSIRQVFGAQNKQSHPLHVGSIKANIGHTEAASGVASVLKILLMIRHGELPPQANFTRLNPSIQSSDLINISTILQPWRTAFRIASVNNYGASGNNTAMIVCQPPKQVQKVERQDDGPATRYPFLLSANTKASLQRTCKSIQQFLASTLQQQHIATSPLRLGDLAFGIVRKQNQRLRYRMVFDAGSIPELQEHLRRSSVDSEAPTVSELSSSTAARPIVMVFAGQNGRSIHISRDAYDRSHLLKFHLDRCDAVFRKANWPSLFPTIFQPMSELDVIQLHCILFAVQYSCARAWIDAGLPVQRVIGHSIGQLTALCVAGCVSLEDAVTLIAGRASLIKKHWGSEVGVMLSVDLDRSSTEELVRSISEEEPGSAVEIACYNGPTRHVLVGTEESISKVETRLRGRKDSRPRRLRTSHGFHSMLADSIMKPYGDLADTITYHEPIIPIETCSPGSSWTRITAELVAQQTRHPVDFLAAVSRTEKLGPCIWIEAGSGSSGISLVRHALQNPEGHSFHAIQLDASDPIASLQRTTQQLWLEGVTLQFWLYHRIGRSSPWSSSWIPGYQFDKTHHWLPYKGAQKMADGENYKAAPRTPTSLITLLSPLTGGDHDVAKFSVDTQNEEYKDWLSSRIVLGSYLCSIASYVGMVTRAAVLLHPPNSGEQHLNFRVSNLSLCAPLGIDVDSALTLTLRPAKVVGEWIFSIDTGIQHARGQVAAMLSLGVSAPCAALRRLIDYHYCESVMADPSASCLRGPLVYKILERVVLCASPCQNIQSTTIRGHESVAHIITPPAPSERSTGNPHAVDQFVLAAEMHIMCREECGLHDVFVCSEVAELLPFSSPPLGRGGSWLVYTRLSWANGHTVICDSLVFDTASQQSVMALLGCRYTRVSTSSLQRSISLANNSHSHRRVHQQQQDDHQQISSVSSYHSEHAATPDPLFTPPTPATPDTEGTGEKIKCVLSHLTGVPPSRLLSTTTLAELGVDSLTTIELQRVFKHDFQVDLPQDIDSGQCTIKDLCAAASVDPSQFHQPPVPSPPTEPGLSSSSVANFLVMPHGGAKTTPSQQDKYKEVCETISRLSRIITDHLKFSDGVSSRSQLQHLGFDSLAAMDLRSQLVQELGTGNLVLPELSPLSTIESLIETVLLSLGQPSLKQICTPNTSVTMAMTMNTTSSCPDSPSTPLSTSVCLPEALFWFAGVQQRYGQLARLAGFEGFYAHVYPRQVSLLTSYIIDAFGALGSHLRYIPAGGTVPRVSHLPKYNKLVDLYYRILEETGIIRRREKKMNNHGGAGDWVRTSSSIDYITTSEAHQAIWIDFPAYRPEHELLHRTGSRLADCLSGQADPLSLLFKGPEAHELLEKVYSDCPMFNTGTRLLNHFLSHVLLASKSNTVRILELGAGTGGTSKHVLERLRAQHINFHYTFSDVSPTLVARARAQVWPSPPPTLDFMVLDIEQPPPQERIQAYDVVISANCIHATKDLGVSSANIHALLRPRGVLCLLELTRDVYWLDAVFGLLDGWWRSEDGRRHPLVDEQQWKDILQKAGFAHVEWTDDESRESDAFRLICGLKS